MAYFETFANTAQLPIVVLEILRAGDVMRTSRESPLKQVLHIMEELSEPNRIYVRQNFGI
jgi:hypothetical protein